MKIVTTLQIKLFTKTIQVSWDPTDTDKELRIGIFNSVNSDEEVEEWLKQRLR